MLLICPLTFSEWRDYLYVKLECEILPLYGNFWLSPKYDVIIGISISYVKVISLVQATTLFNCYSRISLYHHNKFYTMFSIWNAAYESMIELKGALNF